MGGKEMLKIDDKLLLKVGLKQTLLDKLTYLQKKHLISFAMDHIKAPNLLRMLTQLISMEINDKKGVILLAMHNIVTTTQLKNLTSAQIQMLINEYNNHHDMLLAAKMVKEMLVLNQQEKLYMKTGGIKGEYYTHQDEAYLEEDAHV